MIKYMCDVDGCGKEAQQRDGEDWVSQEMFDMTRCGFGYFWARVGFANKTLCKEHRAIAMKELVRLIEKQYQHETTFPLKPLRPW